MGEDFDPMERGRPPRSEGWREHTESFGELLDERGDQRIGQFIVNALYHYENLEGPEDLQSLLFNLEAPELVEILKEYIGDRDL